ncbi:MAG: lipoprotein-releasing ABC transporter permease subunit [Gammaproteobacteria bacterium]|nr:lipoprotein-releasing ABC transporter permease subunit [Gammaproteobacteria bacterium]
MFKPLELYIGLRYVRARRRNGFISFISLSSMLGIALGVATLIVVLSVMNGFERELKQKILGMVSHLTLSGYDGTLSDWPELAQQARKHPEVLAAAPYVQREAMMMNGQLVHGAIVRGVVPELERGVSEIDDFMVAGDLDALQPGSYGVVLGIQLAQALGAHLGSKVNLVAPQATVTPAGVMPRMRRLTVVGIFKADHSQFDTVLAVMNMDDAAKIFRMQSRVSGVRLKLSDMFRARAVGQAINDELGGAFWAVDWTQLNANFFKALKMEKTAMFIILTLIVAVAAFNIVSTLVMVVTDKRSDIAILRTFGASPGKVMRIFMIQGTLIGSIGTVFGLISGVLLALNVETVLPRIEEALGRKILPPDIYYITEVPSELRWDYVLPIGLIAFGLTVLSTIYPAWRASRTQPAEALRYE